MYWELYFGRYRVLDYGFTVPCGIFGAALAAGCAPLISIAVLSLMERARPAFLIAVLRGFALILPLEGLPGMTGIWPSCPAAELGTAAVTACLSGKNGLFRKQKKMF